MLDYRRAQNNTDCRHGQRLFSPPTDQLTHREPIGR